MIEALTRTLWGVRRAAADGVPTEQRLEAARMTMSDTETMTDRANREAIAAGEAAIDRLTALYNAAEQWDFEPEDTGTSAERFKLFDDAEGSQILDGVLRPCASVADEAAAAITLLIAALTAMQGRR